HCAKRATIPALGDTTPQGPCARFLPVEPNMSESCSITRVLKSIRAAVKGKVTESNDPTKYQPMKTRRLIVPKLLLPVIVVTLLAGSLNSHAQYTNVDWPPTIDTNAVVDYAIFDPDVSGFPSTPGGWIFSISLAGGGDQAFTLSTLGGLKGDEGTSAFMNLSDGNYAQFGTVPVLDVLLQVWGDDSLYNANGSGKTVTFNEGILGTEFKAIAGVAPPGGNNQRWNWMLLTITNPVSPHVENTTGLRYVGFQSSTVPPGAQNGGVNNGTLRIEGVAGLAIRAAAIGPAGAFGTSNAINVFLPPPPCPSEPAVNLAYMDINASVTNNLV